jgi:hypothetical protein
LNGTKRVQMSIKNLNFVSVELTPIYHITSILVLLSMSALSK